MKKAFASQLQNGQECTIRGVTYKCASPSPTRIRHLVKLLNNGVEFFVDKNIEVEVAETVEPSSATNKYVILGTVEVGLNICTYSDREAATEAITYFGNEFGHPPSDFYIVRVGYLRTFIEDMEEAIKKGF